MSKFDEYNMHRFGQRPKLRSEPDRLRGCGDPDCRMCNPEVAAKRRRNGATERAGESRSDSERESGFYRDYAPQRESNAEYNEAKNAVSAWLVDMNDQSFDDIIGNDEALEQLRDAIEAPVKHKALYEAYGLQMPKGALLSGPPGCGKTMFARAAANEMKRLYGTDGTCLIVNGASLQSMFVGQTEARIKSMFTFARLYKKRYGTPLLIFIDECEVILPDRTGRNRAVASWEESQVACFLAEMDGVAESGAFVLLATNRPDQIDQAVLRDGRCDFKITVRRPTREALKAILAKNFADTFCANGDVSELVFAGLEALTNDHLVIAHAAELTYSKKDGAKMRSSKNFTLADIVSGAMAAGLPTRAKRLAFARDKKLGQVRGVTPSDVVEAVNILFHENKSLNHDYAMQEFMENYQQEVEARNERKGGE